jgi:hypothetical protein
MVSEDDVETGSTSSLADVEAGSISSLTDVETGSLLVEAAGLYSSDAGLLGNETDTTAIVDVDLFTDTVGTVQAESVTDV